MKTQRARLFQNGGSQAVRLPKACRFPPREREVLVRQDGVRVILEPLDAWSAEFRACLGAWSGKLERPKQVSLKKLDSARLP